MHPYIKEDINCIVYVSVYGFTKLSVFSNPLHTESYQSNGVAFGFPGAVTL